MPSARTRTTSRKRQARFRRMQFEQAISQQVAAYNQLVQVGISLVKVWAVASTILPEHIKVLGALLTFVDASFHSDKPRKAKTDAIGLALRAAYLYGQHQGVLPPAAPATPDRSPLEQEDAG